MKIAIYGYGNLGRGVELACAAAADAELVGVFTRRDPAAVKPVFETTKVFPAADVLQFQERIDVLVICGGSATDLPHMTPELARHFNVVDSFDTHAAIAQHFDAVDAAARESGHLGLISAGWDPGLFSLARIYAGAVLPECHDYTFWGRGVSQGHSDAIRRIPGVLDARQYTIPIDKALDTVRSGCDPVLTPREKHWRECFVVAREGADQARIEEQIKMMPNYFEPYDTVVHFISAEEMQEKHSRMPHGGSVICTGKTGANNDHNQVVEFHLELDSNPEFTASVLLSCARAVDRMHRRGCVGGVTMMDVAPADLSLQSREQLRKHLL